MKYLLFTVFFAGLAAPQTPPPSFDVANVKINIDGTGRHKVNISNGTFLAYNVPLRPLIAEAWTITPDGIDGPAWLDTVSVDITAKGGRLDRACESAGQSP